MDHSSISLEPLVDYLQPQFGNIYDYNFEVIDQFEVQKWTGELRRAVKGYLMHEAPKDVVDQLARPLGKRDTKTREQQVNSIIANYSPWEIAQAFHEAAVIAVPTLHALIGNLDHWPDGDECADATLWLKAHATDEPAHGDSTN